jgi:hypothetical protein
VVLALLAAAVMIGAPRLVPRDRLAAQAAEALAAATGARVTVETASATLVGGPGLRLRGVRLEANEAWQVTLESAEVSLAVAPLLGRELVVDRLVATGPAAAALAGGRAVALTSFTLEANGLGLAVPAAAAGASEAASAAGPGGRWPGGLRGTVTLRAAQVAIGGFTLADVEAEVHPRGRRLVIDAVTATCGGGDLALDGEVDLGVAPATWDLSLRLVGVDAAALLGEWVPAVATQLDTRLTGEVSAGGIMAAGDVMAGHLAAGDAALAALRAEAHLGVGPGVVRAGPWLESAAPYLGARRDLVDVKVAEGRLAARIAVGRCLVDTLVLRGPDTDWALAGALDLVAPPGAATGPAIQMGVHLRLPPGFTPELGSLAFLAEAMRDADRRINLDLGLRGPLANPGLTLDLAAMSRRMRPR